MRRGLIMAVAVLASCAGAEPPEGSLRPESRGSEVSTEEGGGLFSSLRPLFRSQKAERLSAKERRLLAKGAVCGDIAIQGEAIGRVPGSGGCGIENAVRVRSVAGVNLSQSATIDCVTATALRRWVETSARPALSREGGGLAGLRVAAHYTCRSRNNQPGAKMSEHGLGRAIDISGFRLANGSEVSVLEGYGSRAVGKPLAKMRGDACGIFGTVLGPGSDGFHEDHFHFDTARHRNGSYCR